LAFIAARRDDVLAGYGVGRRAIDRRGAAYEINAQVARTAAPIDAKIRVAQSDGIGLGDRALGRRVAVAIVDRCWIDAAPADAIISIDLPLLDLGCQRNRAGSGLPGGGISNVAGRHVARRRAASGREWDAATLAAADAHPARVRERIIADDIAACDNRLEILGRELRTAVHGIAHGPVAGVRRCLARGFTRHSVRIVEIARLAGHTPEIGNAVCVRVSRSRALRSGRLVSPERLAVRFGGIGCGLCRDACRQTGAGEAEKGEEKPLHGSLRCRRARCWDASRAPGPPPCAKVSSA